MAARSKVLGVILARKGSERFPGKHHALVLGQPLISYTLKAAAAAKRMERVVLSSDDLGLRELAKAEDVDFLERPAALAQATTSLEDPVRHACRHLEAEGFHPDVVAVMQANLPLRPEGQIDAVIERLEGLPEATAVCTAVEIRYRPEWAKVLVEERTGKVKRFMAGKQPWRKQDLPRLFAPDGAVLAVRRETLFETEGQQGAHVWLGERLHILPQPDPVFAIEVDYPDEIPVVEYHLRRLRNGQGPAGQD